MADKGWDDAEKVFVGSSVMGVRGENKEIKLLGGDLLVIPKRTPFDELKKSDWDIAIVSEKMWERSLLANIHRLLDLREGHSR